MWAVYLASCISLLLLTTTAQDAPKPANDPLAVLREEVPVAQGVGQMINSAPLPVRRVKFADGDWNPLRVTFQISERCDDKMRKHMKGKTLQEKLRSFHAWWKKETEASQNSKAWVEGLWELMPDLPDNAPLKWKEYVKAWRYTPLTSTFAVEVEDSPVADALFNLLERIKTAACIEWISRDKYIAAEQSPTPRFEAKSLPQDDPAVNQQGSLFQVGVLNNTETGNVGAWEFTRGGSAVVVAVLDTGVNYRHADLRDNMWTNVEEIPGDGIDNDNNGYVDDVIGWDFVQPDNDPMDEDEESFHGSNVAGIIGARGGNNFGIVGVSWEVQIMALRVLNANGGGSTLAVVNAIDYAIMMGAHVINLSLGGSTEDPNLRIALERCAEVGVLAVVAAGNNAADLTQAPEFPTQYSKENPVVLSVGAVDSRDELASFSNFGDQVPDVAAPGVSIPGPAGGSTSFILLSGTSQATPHVAGIAALLLSVILEREGAEATFGRGELLKQIILESAEPVDGLASRTATGRRVNAGRAVALLLESRYNEKTNLTGVDDQTNAFLSSIGKATGPRSAACGVHVALWHVGVAALAAVGLLHVA